MLSRRPFFPALYIVSKSTENQQFMYAQKSLISELHSQCYRHLILNSLSLSLIFKARTNPKFHHLVQHHLLMTHAPLYKTCTKPKCKLITIMNYHPTTKALTRHRYLDHSSQFDRFEPPFQLAGPYLLPVAPALTILFAAVMQYQYLAHIYPLRSHYNNLCL